MTRRSVLGALVVLAAGSLSLAGEGVVTNFAILVGFPSGEEAAAGGVLLVPGTVIPMAREEVSEGERRDLVDRSLSFTSAVGKLWSTFRLDPTRKLQKGKYVMAGVGDPVELPSLEGADVQITATLLGFSDEVATYRVVFLQGAKAIADSTVNVNRGGRAVVGGMDGEAAPYVFLLVEPEAAGAEVGMRFHEELGLTAPVAVEKTNPVYPEEARRQRIMGLVVVDTLIDTDGTVLDVRILESPHPLLAEAASEAVRQWRFEPARKADGTPARVLYVLTMKFALR